MFDSVPALVTALGPVFMLMILTGPWAQNHKTLYSVGFFWDMNLTQLTRVHIVRTNVKGTWGQDESNCHQCSSPWAHHPKSHRNVFGPWESLDFPGLEKNSYLETAVHQDRTDLWSVQAQRGRSVGPGLQRCQQVGHWGGVIVRLSLCGFVFSFFMNMMWPFLKHAVDLASCCGHLVKMSQKDWMLLFFILQFTEHSSSDREPK